MAAKKKKEDATSMAARQREIAVSEFFSKNRHLLGFDNPTKALLTTVREAVDNSLDASEEAHILPRLMVKIEEVQESRFAITVADEGPGIIKAQLGKIFGQLLYGSKFHRLKQSRGQQGIGISAAVMYGQMTTGQPAVIVSKTGKGRPANRIWLQIDTKKNKPQIIQEDQLDDPEWNERVSGTSITITLEGHYKGGRHGIDAYLRQTALANPHAHVTFTDPKGKVFDYPRVVDELPVEPKEIKPHPYGVELGTLMRMLHDARGATVSGFLKGSFSRVSGQIADDICKIADVNPEMSATKAGRTESEALYKAIQQTKIMSPPTSCLSPIGEDAMVKGLYWLFVEAQRERTHAKEAEAAAERAAQMPLIFEGKEGEEANEGDGESDAEGDGESDAEDDAPEDNSPAAMLKRLTLDEDGAIADEDRDIFVTAVTRPPSVYRGNPFQVEAGLFYGKGLPADELARVYRFANRVPLQYQASACAIHKAVVSAPWRNYEVQQSRGALPAAPMVVLVHIASAWVPYTSESKEAIASYDEILKDLRLAIMECGRRLQRFLRRRRREADEAKKRSYIIKYIDPIGEALQDILGLSDEERDETIGDLRTILERTRNESGKSGKSSRRSR